TVLGFPQDTVARIADESLRIAMAVAPDRRQRARCGHEWIVRGHGAIVAQAVDLAVGPAEILRVFLHAAFADGEEDVPRIIKHNTTAVVHAAGPAVEGEIGLINNLLVDPNTVANA